MDTISTLEKIYWKLEKLIAPKLKYSQYLYEDALFAQVDEKTEWLDIGCGHHVLPPWQAKQEQELVAKCSKVIGIDAEVSSLVKHRSISRTVAGNISRLPFRDSTFNLVTANMVIEHLDDPESQFREIVRVLKPGGTFIMHTPNRMGYSTVAARLIPEFIKKRLVYLLQRRKEEDVFKTYYRANSQSDIGRLAGKAGLEVKNVRMIVSSAAFIFVPPLVIFELLWIRLLMTKTFRSYRTNIIATLRKPNTTLLNNSKDTVAIGALEGN